MQSIYLEPKRSKQLLLFLIILHLGASLCVLIIDVVGWLKLTLIVLVIISYSHHFKKFFLLQNYKSIIKLWSHSAEPNTISKWYLQNGLDEIKPAQLAHGSFISNFLIIMNFKGYGSRSKFSVVLCRDALDPTSFRQLLVYLKIYGHVD